MYSLKSIIKNNFGPRPASTVLAELRSNPEKIFKNFGFIVKRDQKIVLPTENSTIDINISSDDQVGGRCKIECVYIDDVYQLSVKLGDSYNDWYIPYRSNQSLHCDVPKGLPNGTLIVTFPMNGCALEVHSSISTNRFYHDHDGKFMPETDPYSWKPKFRVESAVYEGKNSPLFTHFVKKSSATSMTKFEENDKNTEDESNANRWAALSMEHSIIIIKRGEYWFVYQTAVYGSTNKFLEKNKYKKIPGPPIFLGQFLDSEPFPAFTRPRQNADSMAEITRPRQNADDMTEITRPRRDSELFFTNPTRPRSNAKS